MSRRAFIQVFLGLVCVLAVWAVGYLDTTADENLSRFPRIVKNFLGLGDGGDSNRGKTGTGQAIASAVIEYPQLTDQQVQELSRTGVRFSISIGGRAAGGFVVELDPKSAPRNVRHFLRAARKGFYEHRTFVKPSATSPGRSQNPMSIIQAAGQAHSRLTEEPSVIIGGEDPIRPRSGMVTVQNLMVAGEFTPGLKMKKGMVGMVRREDPAVFQKKIDRGATGPPGDFRREYADSATHRFFVFFDNPAGSGQLADSALAISGSFSMIGHVRDPVGLEVLKKIGSQETSSTGRPFKEVVIESVEVIELK